MTKLIVYVMENTPFNCRLFLRIYKLERILLHNTFPSATVFSFYIFSKKKYTFNIQKAK